MFIFLLQSHLAEAAFSESIGAVNPLEERSRSALEAIKATLEGRIRFNEEILCMLNDDSTPISERLFEFYEMQGIRWKDKEVFSPHHIDKLWG
ncbi:MAG: hypothetical protein NT128_02415 [Proteobacteria bacterium]|nr:hypothetical protein [Pseudomonadota bacterium]